MTDTKKQQSLPGMKESNGPQIKVEQNKKIEGNMAENEEKIKPLHYF